jgi:NADH dehydrogenase [ubiquinone] 1 alpha subcomplex assembly factor 5
MQSQPLVGWFLQRHKPFPMTMQAPPHIFDYQRRKAIRQRAAAQASDSFLWDYMADDIADRLACTLRDFEKTLIIGPLSSVADRLPIAKLGAITCLPDSNEDALALGDQRFDLILSAASLDSTNDLPGALIQIRRALRPDGLFLGMLFGAGALIKLKAAMLAAEAGANSPHIHPQIELRAVADLLARAGFTLQVADQHGLEVRYGDWRRLVSDLRDAGIGNALSGTRHFLGKGIAQRLDLQWQTMAETDGKVTERFEFIHLSGWAPDARQPKPAARGSGAASLADVLAKPKDS